MESKAWSRDKCICRFECIWIPEYQGVGEGGQVLHTPSAWNLALRKDHHEVCLLEHLQKFGGIRPINPKISMLIWRPKNCLRLHPVSNHQRFRCWQPLSLITLLWTATDLIWTHHFTRPNNCTNHGTTFKLRPSTITWAFELRPSTIALRLKLFAAHSSL